MPGWSEVCDDSLRLQAEGFWNVTGVSSHTIRSVHAQQRDTLKTTAVSHGTTLAHGSIFTSDPTPENTAKRSSVENVQENYIHLLFERSKGGNVDPTPLQKGTALSSPQMNQNGFQWWRFVTHSILDEAERNYWDSIFCQIWLTCYFWHFFPLPFIEPGNRVMITAVTICYCLER